MPGFLSPVLPLGASVPPIVSTNVGFFGPAAFRFAGYATGSAVVSESISDGFSVIDSLVSPGDYRDIISLELSINQDIGFELGITRAVTQYVCVKSGYIFNVEL